MAGFGETSNIQSGCYKCEKRVAGCHQRCKQYKEYKERIQELKERELKRKGGSGYAR